MDKSIPMDAALPPASGTFLGQPKGVAYLAMTEAWERFSFYGMRGLLILYMVQDLLLPGRIESVAGMGGFRSAVEWVFGPLSDQAFASQTFGLYAGFVYFTPLFGGLIADRWLGAKKTVMIGILLMTAGHFAMVFDASFLLALLLLVLGSGCLKGNVAAQVGHLYGPDEEERRTRGYVIFSTGINIGATLGPFVCGLVAQVWGWHAGFGTAGVMMLLAAVVYFAGWKHMADDRPVRNLRQAETPAPPLGRAEWATILLVVVVLMLNLFQFLAYDQTSNAGALWVADRVDLATPLGAIPVAWFFSEDAASSVVIVPFLIGLWAWQGRHGGEPHDTGKMACGAVVMGLSVLTLALGDWTAGEGGKASIVFPIIAYFLSGVAFMFSWPTMLALVSRRAPAGVNAVMMAAVYLTAFATGVGAGWIARFYETMPGWQFWGLHAALCFAGAALLAVLGPVLRQRMDRLESKA